MALQNKATKVKLSLIGLTMRHLQCTDAVKGAGARVVTGESYNPGCAVLEFLRLQSYC